MGISVKTLEKNRFSILTDDMEHCYICKKPKEDINEIFMGRNRQNSMKYGLCIPMCRKCHNKFHEVRAYQLHIMKEAQEVFEKIYSHEEFMQIFRENYKD